MTATYTVTTETRDYSSTSAREIASVAHAWAKQGLSPALWATVSKGDAPLRLPEVAMGRTVRETAQALSASAQTTAMQM